jgi:hypothetical protein
MGPRPDFRKNAPSACEEVLGVSVGRSFHFPPFLYRGRPPFFDPFFIRPRSGINEKFSIKPAP